MIDADEARSQFINNIARPQEIENWKVVCSTAQGRAAVWRVLAECGVYSASFQGEHTHQTAYNEGKRAIGLWLLTELFTADSNVYRLMQQESEQRALEADILIRHAVETANEGGTDD